MNIQYPVKYDAHNQSVDDASGVVLAIIGWQGIIRAIEDIDFVGNSIAHALNSSRMDKVGSASPAGPAGNGKTKGAWR